MTRRVLVVTYYFPPTGGIGYERTLKYVTYLPEHGWDATVLTVKDAGFGLRDEASIGRIPPATDVIRARSAEPAKVRRSLGGAVRRIKRRGRGSSPAVSRGGSEAATSGPGILSRIWSGAVTWLFFPDQQVGWVPFALRAGTRAARRSGARVVYSTSSPISSHLLAGLIARRTKLPWVADYRDPWVGNTFARELPRWQRPLQRRVERWILRNADRIVMATGALRDSYAGIYPWAARKMCVIPNGYDRRDFSPEVLAAMKARAGGPKPAGSKFKLAYGGSMYGEHELEIFLDGLELLLARRPELRDKLEVEFIGWLTVHNREVAARYETPERLGSVVKYAGFLPRGEAMLRMVQADALFHVFADEPGKGQFMSTKLVEYVGLDQQVIAFVPKGAARDLLLELDWGIVADPTPDGIAAGIEKLLVTPRPARSADPEGRYDRANLAAQLAHVLDEVADAPGRPSADRV